MTREEFDHLRAHILELQDIVEIKTKELFEAYERCKHEFEEGWDEELNQEMFQCKHCGLCTLGEP